MAVTSIMKPAASFTAVVSGSKSGTASLSSSDFVVIVGGSNYVSRNEGKNVISSLKGTLSSLTHTNVVVVNLPLRHDLMEKSCVNEAVKDTNVGIAKLLVCICVQTSHEKSLQSDEINIRNEMSSISMVDEFAKHARLQRKLIKIQEQLKTAANKRNSSHGKYKLILTCSAQLVVTLIFMAFVWVHYYTPIAILPPQWLKPFDAVLSWPTGVEGGISIMWWLLLLGTGVRTIMAQVVA